MKVILFVQLFGDNFCDNFFSHFLLIKNNRETKNKERE